MSKKPTGSVKINQKQNTFRPTLRFYNGESNSFN